MRLKIKTRWLPLLLLFAYLINGKAFAQGSPCITTPIPPCVTEAIDRGLTWLRNTQDMTLTTQGSWDPIAPGPATPPSQYGVATAGLAVMAFLENGYPPSDPTVCRAINYITGKYHPNEGIYQKTAAGFNPFEDKVLYQTAIAVIALIEVEKSCTNGCDITLPDDVPNLSTLIQNAVNCIVASQWNSLAGRVPPTPTWDGGFTYGPLPTSAWTGGLGHKRPDISNTKFALWALCIAKGAGYRVFNLVWPSALDFVLNTQHGSGGFDYGPSSPTVLGSRTAAALMSLWFIRCFIGSMTSLNGNTIINLDNAATSALNWWQNNYSYCCNPGYGGDGYYYYVLSAARAFHYWGSLNTPTGLSYATDLGIAPSAGALGLCLSSCPPTPIQHLSPASYPGVFSSISAVWYKDFASQLIALQSLTGNWNVIAGGFDGGTTIATLFALLALSTVNLPPSMTSDHIRPIVDWTIPCDCECVCCDSCYPPYYNYMYICAHIQDGCCSEGIDPESISVKINLECCDTFTPNSVWWLPDNSDGTSGTVIIRIRCDSLCNTKSTFDCSYDSSFKVSVCLWAKDNAGNPLFPNPYTWEFMIDKDAPWVEMYYPLCLTCEDTTPHIIWPQDTCCGKHLWDGYFRFVTYHPCNLNCDTITIETWEGDEPSEHEFVPGDPGISYRDFYCTGEIDSIEVDLVEALDLPWKPYYADFSVVDTCFDSLEICLQVCDHALDISRFNWQDTTCSPDTIVCHKDTCCWKFHNVRIHRERVEPEHGPIHE